MSRASLLEHRPVRGLRAAVLPAQPKAPWRSTTILLAGLLLLTLALRVPGINRPLLGHFATKSAVYGMIARNLAEGRAGFFEPTLDLLKNGERSLHMLELPLPAYLTGMLWTTLGGSLDVWGRATSVAWSLAGVWLMYRYLLGRHGSVAAFGGAAALALSPVGIVFGQTFQLEAALVPLSFGALLALDAYLKGGKSRWLVLAVACAAVLFVTKVFMVVLLVPLAWSCVETRRFGWRLALAGGIAVLPAALWYGYVYWAVQGNGGFPVDRLYYSVRDSAGAHGVPHPLLATPAFYLRVAKDLAGPVLSPVGCALFLLGLVSLVVRAWHISNLKSPASDFKYLAWLAAVAALVLLLPRKFQEMSYYWVGMLPVFCAIAGIGFSHLWEQLPSGSRRVQLFALAGGLVWLGLSGKLAYQPAFVTPNEDAGVVAAAEQVRGLSPPESRVVTVHGTSLALLYHCDRPGWVWEVAARPKPLDASALAQELAEYRGAGAEWLVVADSSLADSPGWRAVVATLPQAATGPSFSVYRLSLADHPAAE